MNQADVQFIMKGGCPEYAVIPIEDYRRMVASLEDLADMEAIDQALREHLMFIVALPMFWVWNRTIFACGWRTKHNGVDKRQRRINCSNLHHFPLRFPVTTKL